MLQKPDHNQDTSAHVNTFVQWRQKLTTTAFLHSKDISKKVFFFCHLRDLLIAEQISLFINNNTPFLLQRVRPVPGVWHR